MPKRIQLRFWTPAGPMAALLLGLVALAACGQSAMVQTTSQMNRFMLGGHYGAALAALQQSKARGHREQDRVVYWMQEGMLLHLLGRYRQSIAALENAERRSDELFTKSVGKGVKAAFTSQAATDYVGEDYERVLLNVVKALDFLRLGDTPGALVEARKINERLSYFNTKYAHKNVYQQDAFAHWLSGMLYEMDKSYDDARIAYEAALGVYTSDFARNYGMGAPSFVAEDLVRVTQLGGDAALAQQYQNKYGVSGETTELLKTHGEVVLVHLNGQGPSKSDFFVTCWFLSAHRWACNAEPGGEFVRPVRIHVPRNGTIVRVAFPKLHLRAAATPYVTMTVGQASARSQAAYPLNAIAAKTLRDHTQRIFRQTILRAITKFLTQKAARAVGNQKNKNLGWLAQAAASVLMQATEESDKRAWTTLPARIDVARALVAPGQHAVGLQLPNGRRVSMGSVSVSAGQRVFLTYRSLP